MKNNILLVCGHRAVDRIKRLISSKNLNLVLRIANDKAEILNELKKNKPPICIIEHDFGFIEMVEQFRSNLFTKFFGDIFKSSEKKTESIEQLKAYNLLPEMIQTSPETRYVITSHIRGSGITKEEKTIYKEFPEVIKVMGFINSNTNISYLLNLFHRWMGVDDSEGRNDFMAEKE